MTQETADLIDQIDAHSVAASALLALVESRLREAEDLERKLAAEQRETRDETEEAVKTLRRAGLLPA